MRSIIIIISINVKILLRLHFPITYINIMIQSVDSLRAHIVAVAHTWLGTPYHTGGRIKGSGVDCLTLLAEAYAEAGVVAPIDIPYYPHDWHLHRGEERYLAGLLCHASEIEGPPLPGDIALWKFGRCFSHGAIVVEWPVIIHAYVGRACTLENADAALWLSHVGEGGTNGRKSRPRKFFSVFDSTDSSHPLPFL